MNRSNLVLWLACLQQAHRERVQVLDGGIVRAIREWFDGLGVVPVLSQGARENRSRGSRLDRQRGLVWPA